MPMSIQDAAYHLVNAYPGGATSLAPRLFPNKSATTLSHEIRPPDGSFAKLGLETAAQLTQLSGNTIIVQAFCERAGGVFVPLPQAGHTGDGEVFKALSKLAKEFGDVVAKVTEVSSDGRISDNDLRAVKKEAFELMGALQQALQVLINMNAQD